MIVSVSVALGVVSLSACWAHGRPGGREAVWRRGSLALGLRWLRFSHKAFYDTLIAVGELVAPLIAVEAG